MKYLMIVLSLCLAQSALSAEKLVSTGEIFDKEGKVKKFNYEKYETIEGNKKLVRAVYKNLDGKILTEEKVEFVDDQLVRYDMDQRQLKQKAWIEVKNKKISFNLKKFRKRNYPVEEKLHSNFIIGLQLVPTMIDNWTLLEEGKEKEIKLGVWHRQESITFDLKKDKSSNDKELVIKMSPASFLIRAIVNPIYFTFDKKSKALTSYKGRVTPKEKRGKSFYDFDGLTRYKAAADTKKISAKEGNGESSKRN